MNPSLPPQSARAGALWLASLLTAAAGCAIDPPNTRSTGQGGAPGESPQPVAGASPAGADNGGNAGLAGAAGALSASALPIAGAASASSGAGGMPAAGAGGGTQEPLASNVLTSVDLKGECRHGVPTSEGETHVIEDGMAYDLVAYGSEMGHHCGQDQGRFSYALLKGDFDVRAQLTAMDNFGALHFKGHATPVKSGLMIRKGLAPSDLYIAIHAASPDEHYPDAFHFDMRREAGGWLGIEGTFSYGYLNASQPIYARKLPNIWVRLQRTGNVFKAYASEDGQTWVAPQGSSQYSADWGDELYVGLSSSSAPEGEFNAKSTTQFRSVTGFPSPAP